MSEAESRRTGIQLPAANAEFVLRAGYVKKLLEKTRLHARKADVLIVDAFFKLPLFRPRR